MDLALTLRVVTTALVLQHLLDQIVKVNVRNELNVISELSPIEARHMFIRNFL